MSTLVRNINLLGTKTSSGYELVYLTTFDRLSLINVYHGGSNYKNVCYCLGYGQEKLALLKVPEFLVDGEEAYCFYLPDGAESPHRTYSKEYRGYFGDGSTVKLGGDNKSYYYRLYDRNKDQNFQLPISCGSISGYGSTNDGRYFKCSNNYAGGGQWRIAADSNGYIYFQYEASVWAYNIFSWSAGISSYYDMDTYDARVSPHVFTKEGTKLASAKCSNVNCTAETANIGYLWKKYNSEIQSLFD